MSSLNVNKTQEFNFLLKYMENVGDFKNELDDISKTWDHLILLSQLGSTGIDMSTTKTNFNALTSELISHLSHETLSKVINEMTSKSQVAVDIVIRNLFERTADIGFLATDDDIRDFLIKTPDMKKRLEVHKEDEDDTQYRIARKELKSSLSHITSRFQEYVEKYSVYYDIVLFDNEGNIVAKLDECNTLTKTEDDILELAKVTTADYLETYKYHDFLPEHKKSLVYTYKVTHDNESEEIIGYLSLCFKFEDEMAGIFSKLIYKENNETILLLDAKGEVIASSDKYHIPLGATLETELENSFKITQFAGRTYIIKTCKTNGYEGFYGLGWLGHIMIPLESAFNLKTHDISIDKNILQSIMENQDLFKKELLDIPIQAQLIQDELDRAVWNGNVSQTDINSSGADFARSILREVRQTGEKTKSLFNTSIEKLNQTIITSLLDNATFLASLSIDIMDRNLYERANDGRWWSLTTTFREILKQENITLEDKEKIGDILVYINDLYTVYTNLFVYDTHGEIIAVSNEKEKKSIGSKLTSSWVKETLQLKDSSKYSVSDFEPTFLYNDDYTYIYGSAINAVDNFDIVGGIGIVFDSKSQFQDMLIDALPQINGKVKKGIFSLFVEKESKKIISCSDNSHQVGDVLTIDMDFFNLDKGMHLSKILEYKGKYYIVGAKCSSNYREYKGDHDDYVNDVLAFVFIEAGTIKEYDCIAPQEENNYYNYQIDAKEEIEEIATFYVGDKWLGVRASEIAEAISMESLESPVSIDSEHHFKGTVSYKNYIVSVLDISPFVKNIETKNLKNDIVLVTYEGALEKHTIGIVVDKLGEIMNVPTKSIKPFDNHLIGGGMLGESIIQPPEGKSSKKLLTLLNISKIGSLDE